MPSPTAASSGSSITRLPYDILHEIFAHCLLRYPLHQRQPSTMKAPILLCHICSPWRRLALRSPTLWAHLSCRLTITLYTDNKRSPFFQTEVNERNIEFLRWWRKNQGQIAPFLSLDMHKRTCDGESLKLTEDNMLFLLEYLSSAQYLELDLFYWVFVVQGFKAGYPMVFPNLHTVVLSHMRIGASAFGSLQTLLQSLSPHALPALRRFSLSETNFIDNFPILPHWSILTDLSLHISISPERWLSLIRAVPHLRWGYFHITPLHDIDIGDTQPPPQCTLLKLTTLTFFIGSDSEVERDFVFPLSSFFTRLHLPSLRTLSLSSPGANTWENRHAIRELYEVLNSTPGVTKLYLEYRNMSFGLHTPLIILPTITDVEPIWHHAMALAHLQFASPAGTRRTVSECEEMLALFVRYIFSADSGWLDLRNTASPIRAVTINDNRPPQYYPISDVTMSSVRESASAVPEVAFNISWVQDTLAGVEVQEEWGSRS